jgi:hypothetical protein
MNKNYIKRVKEIVLAGIEYNMRNTHTKASVISSSDTDGMPCMSVSIHAVDPESNYISMGCSAYLYDTYDSDRINQILGIKKAATRSNE